MIRSCRTERTMAVLVGLVALLLGFAALALHYWRVDRPVLDPVALDWARGHLPWVRAGLVVAGLLAVLSGLLWAWRAVRSEAHPDLVLDDGLVVTPDALAAAVRADAERVDGVAAARVSVVGASGAPKAPDAAVRTGAGKRVSATGAPKAPDAAARADAGKRVSAVGSPALRVRLVLRPGADVRAVWQALDARVLAGARTALEATVPAAVVLELGAKERKRVH
ncbi:hypothetical protein [Saccharothrix syringae]|uniref:Alkaline shock response membrane anchor protein AmaP n=1 Tax=Saccharothrix syringae TaxID=103733 RepID=A0A5Q0GUH7_SACSY|nr:hypothetical protein [Saccharothrix syringae]QFZ17648.1 alkaline shock response membrane anchor protein AmaP [Saccharothrix syringae]